MNYVRFKIAVAVLLMVASSAFAHDQGGHGSVGVSPDIQSSYNDSKLKSQWKTDFNEPLSLSLTQDWFVSKVTVTAPRTLRANDRNTWAPRGDIVWHGDLPGDRHKQIEDLVQYGALKGSDFTLGNQNVHLDIWVVQFHGMTPRAIRTLNRSGVYNIQLIASIHDEKTGAVLVPPTRINASVKAIVGQAYLDAIATGMTQRDYVSDHIALVFRDWLARGPEVRQDFERLGR